jgi:hypothetical protein
MIGNSSTFASLRDERRCAPLQASGLLRTPAKTPGPQAGCSPAGWENKMGLPVGALGYCATPPMRGDRKHDPGPVHQYLMVEVALEALLMSDLRRTSSQ